MVYRNYTSYQVNMPDCSTHLGAAAGLVFACCSANVCAGLMKGSSYKLLQGVGYIPNYQRNCIPQMNATEFTGLPGLL